MLLEGAMNAASMLASLTLSKSLVTMQKYDVLASLLNSGVGLSCTHLRHIPVAFVGDLEFQNRDGQVEPPVVHLKPVLPPEDRPVESLGKKARLERAEKHKKFWEDQPELKPVLQNARISQLTHRVVHDQVMFATISEAMTVNDTYTVALHLIKELKEVGYTHPMMMQFDATDPSSGHTFSIVTNIRLVSVEQDSDDDQEP